MSEEELKKPEERFIYNIKGISLEYFQELVNSNVWKAFAIIYAGIHHQMKIILVYKDKIKVSTNNHAKRWTIINNKSFFQCIDDLYIIEAINDELHQELKEFNTNRNKKLGHLDAYQKLDISDETINNICLHGIKLSKKLDKIIHSIFFPS